MATKRKSANLAVPMECQDWQGEEDLRTMVRAEEIKKDPKRFAKVTALAKKKMMMLMCLMMNQKLLQTLNG